ncbi:MAG: hypothetical protein K2I75_04795 [Clostridiales bacterium]|nr:hypothetical protein [Clostridiales bacterium]
MKNNAKRFLCAALAATTAFSFAACSTEAAESSFDSPLPWHVSDSSYEKLGYDVAIYNTQKSEAEGERVEIAKGTMIFTLEEGADQGYTKLDMSFAVTYLNVDEAGIDAGLTDTIESTVLFEPNSLAAKSMHKKVTLADRKDTKNLSYEIDADYFGTHKATFKYFKQDGAEQKTHTLPNDTCRDNEMAFFLARAQAISGESSTNFKMVNLYDTFNSGKTTEYRMVVNGNSERTMDLGEWVKDYGIEAVTDESNGKTTYPVTCITTTIGINDEKHGPSYTVLYAKNAFKVGSTEHKKLPIKITYGSYNGSNPYRLTSYTLTSCSFTKTAE